MTTKVNFRLLDELIDRADVAAKVSQKNRTEILKEALRAYLQDDVGANSVGARR